MRPVAATVVLLFIALCHSSLAQSAGADEELAVPAGAPLTVTCALRVEERAEWRRDGGPPPADMRASERPAGAGLVARLAAPAARAHHAGRYTCSPRARAVRVRVLPAPRAGPEPSSEPAVTAEPADDDWLELSYHQYKPLMLNCSVGPGVDVSNVAFTWLVNNTAPEASALRGRYKLSEGGARLTVERALEDDFGNYTCLAAGDLALRWRVRAVPILRMLADSSVVEGQKLKLTCRVIGKPYPKVNWLRLESEADNGTDALEFLGERAKVQESAAGVPDGELVLEAAAREHAGLYACAAPGAEKAVTMLRVKDMYAALWPFLGICAEVFVLCAIILVYEKRRTKPECDDSDTDNHEQKKS